MSHFLTITHRGKDLALLELHPEKPNEPNADFTLSLNEIQAVVGADRLQLQNLTLCADPQPTDRPKLTRSSWPQPDSSN